MDLEKFTFPAQKITRREVLIVPASGLLLACTKRAPDLVVVTELGPWHIWGNKKADGKIDYTSGEYTFEFPKRSLLIPRTYPNHVRVDFDDFYSVIEVVRLNSREMHFIGALLPQDTSKPYISQWSHWDKNPDYTRANKVRVTWKDMMFDKIVWNNTTVADRKL